MGKQWTERQRVEAAARRELVRRQTELGPLFADQAEPVDLATLANQRKMGQARNIEHLHRILATVDLEARLQEQYLRRLARTVLGEWFAPLAVYARNTYPSASYRAGFWLRRLASSSGTPSMHRSNWSSSYGRMFGIPALSVVRRKVCRG